MSTPSTFYGSRYEGLPASISISCVHDLLPFSSPGNRGMCYPNFTCIHLWSNMDHHPTSCKVELSKLRPQARLQVLLFKPHFKIVLKFFASGYFERYFVRVGTCIWSNNLISSFVSVKENNLRLVNLYENYI